MSCCLAEEPDQRAQREQSDYLAYKDHCGRKADFHSNRHTFITNLGRVGVSPRTVQTLSRHSDARLTMNVYSHTELAEKRDAVNRLKAIWECAGVAGSRKLSKVGGGRGSRSRAARTAGRVASCFFVGV